MLFWKYFIHLPYVNTNNLFFFCFVYVLCDVYTLSYKDLYYLSSRFHTLQVNAHTFSLLLLYYIHIFAIIFNRVPQCVLLFIAHTFPLSLFQCLRDFLDTCNQNLSHLFHSC